LVGFQQLQGSSEQSAFWVFMVLGTFLWIGKANGTNWVDNHGQGIEIQHTFWLLFAVGCFLAKKVEKPF